MTGKPFSIQVTIDCGSPHDLADWWAETLAWQVEPQDETFIQSMIDQGFASEADTTRHNDSLVWSSGAAIMPGQQATSGQPRILFQQVPETKSLKNRIHLDLRPDADADLEAIHQGLVERGAIKVGEGEQGPHRWITYADPEGNEFCIDA